jgi:hypothetical protein
MNLIGCLDSPSQGKYWVNGQLESELDDDELARIHNKEIGFVLQTFNRLATQRCARTWGTSCRSELLSVVSKLKCPLFEASEMSGFVNLP